MNDWSCNQKILVNGYGHFIFILVTLYRKTCKSDILLRPYFSNAYLDSQSWFDFNNMMDHKIWWYEMLKEKQQLIIGIVLKGISKGDKTLNE